MEQYGWLSWLLLFGGNLPKIFETFLNTAYAAGNYKVPFLPQFSLEPIQTL